MNMQYEDLTRLALFRERRRAQYRRRQQQHAAVQLPTNPRSDRALWLACLHVEHSTGLASSQLGSTSYAAASSILQPLSDASSADVIGVLREHVVREASRIAGVPTLCHVSANNGALDVTFDQSIH